MIGKEEKSNCLSRESSKSKTRAVLLCSTHNRNIRKTEKKAQKYFNALTKKEQQIIIQQFEDEKITSDILKTFYKREGLDGVVFRVMFERYVQENKMYNPTF